MNAPSARRTWSVEEIEALFELPFLELAFRAQSVHRMHQEPGKVQLCTLSNIKRGGCPEDCSYCPQAARYDTGVKGESLAPVDEVVEQARRARDAGATRFCMGAAWRQVRDNAQFDRVVEMVEAVADMGLEVCATLGMLKPHQAERLAKAGLTAYNHNLDTSREHYAKIISTRTYDDRLNTLQTVRDAGITVCCGGIVGLGETTADRAKLLHTLSELTPHPESVPINKLVAAPGTPLGESDEVDAFDFLRTIAVARIVLPTSRIRLAAGRGSLSDEGQALAFLCGANSIFYGEELLTTPNPKINEDRALLDRLRLEPMPARPLQAAR